MKKNSSNIFLTFFLIFIGISFTSCDLFTTSVLSFTARDLKESLKTMPTESLIAAGKDSSVIGNQSSAQAALEVLGERLEELEDLSPEQAENVMNLATAAIIPVSTFGDILNSMIGQDGNQNTENEGSEGSEGSEETEENNATEVLASLMNSIPVVDTAALEVILSNQENLTQSDITSTALATVALMASAVKSEESLTTEENQLQVFTAITQNLGSDDVKNAETTKAKVAAALNGTGVENNDALKIAITAALTITEREDIGDLSIGGFNIGTLLGASTEESNQESN